jgi:hypothetical protein
MSLNIAKSVVHLRSQNISDESKINIFNYYLEWFFGNTDNPFSKEVRQTANFIVQTSVFLGEFFNSSKCNLVTLSNLVQIFEGICRSSPRTVKSTQDIVELWYH